MVSFALEVVVRYCEVCKTTYSPDTSVCPKDHNPTTTLSAAINQDRFIGKIVGSYQVTERLAVGGMGAVYKAKHTTLGRFGAVKFLLVDNPALAERFLVEAKLLSQLDHPHIVGIYDLGLLEGTPYYLMEHLEGESLAKLLSRRSPSLDEILRILLQLLDALQAVHQAGIIHRDIKPENIFLKKAERGFVKLLDFGIAKSLNSERSLTQSGAIMGTPHYLSPEQAKGEATDVRSDLYSVGVVLFEMVCGRLPFLEQNFAMLLLAHISQPPPLVRQLNPSLPASLEAVLEKALQKRREDRYQSAKDMMRELERLLEGPSRSFEDLPTMKPQRLSALQDRTSTIAPDTIRFSALEDEPKPLWSLPTTFGRYCSYEYVEQSRALHISYQHCWVEDEFVAEAMQEELLELLELFGQSWLVVCFDNTEFSVSGAESLAARLSLLAPKTQGIISYVSHRLPRFELLNEHLLKSQRAQLIYSKEAAIQEFHRRAQAAPVGGS